MHPKLITERLSFYVHLGWKFKELSHHLTSNVEHYPAKKSENFPLLRRICEECKFAAESDARYEAHLKEPRHVNYYRNLAYMQPKKRQVSELQGGGIKSGPQVG